MSTTDTLDPPVPPGEARVSLTLTTWALFTGLAALLTGVGLYATLSGVRAELERFGTVYIGVIGAVYYGGFILGSRVALHVVGTVGHIRVFSALCSLMSAVTLVSGLIVHPLSWIVLRFLSGACLAGVYVVAESWLNQLASNANRGRLLSFYGMLTTMSYGLGQLLFGLIDPRALTGFTLATIGVSVAVAPVALSAVANPPPILQPEPISIRQLMDEAATGVVAAILVGVTIGAFISFLPIYATRSGMSFVAVGAFVAMPPLGSLILHMPVAVLSDRGDRRIVGAASATIAAAASGVLWMVGPSSPIGFLAAAVIGGTMYPLYSIAGAYTNDKLSPERLTAAASQLVVLYGVGSFIGPLIAAVVIRTAGDAGFPWTVLVMHALIAVFLMVRVVQYPPAERAVPSRDIALDSRVLQIPATVAGMGRRLRPRAPRRR
ncbi:MAG: hypothetical protein RL058_1680 [Actinomycetota bacterium]